MTKKNQKRPLYTQKNCRNLSFLHIFLHPNLVQKFLLSCFDIYAFINKVSSLKYEERKPPWKRGNELKFAEKVTVIRNDVCLFVFQFEFTSLHFCLSVSENLNATKQASLPPLTFSFYIISFSFLSALFAMKLFFMRDECLFIWCWSVSRSVLS